MEFRNIVSNDIGDISVIRSNLLERIDLFIAENPRKEFNFDIGELLKLKEIVLKSGEHDFESRYGNVDSTFSVSELVKAYSKDYVQSIRYLVYRYQFKHYPTNKFISKFPIVLAIEPSSLCNLKCIMCFQTNEEFSISKHSKGIMSMEIFDKVISEAKEYGLPSIVFASRGEPLINPNIDFMITNAAENGVLDIKLNTNGVLLTREMSRKILRTPLNTIVFSVDSVDEDRYKSIRGVELKKVLENIETFIKIKEKEFSESTLRTRVSMVIVDAPDLNREDEIEKAKKYWKDRVDEFAYKSENNFKSVYDEGSESINIEPNPCSLIWERLYIWYDGTINPCDIDHLSELAIGNIQNGDLISKVWTGEKMKQLREDHLKNGKRITCPCSNCIGY